MPDVVIKVVATTAKVLAQPVRPVAVTLADGARMAVVAVPGAPGSPGDAVSQIVISGAAAEALSGHSVVTRRPDGTLEYASNDNPAHQSLPLWVTTGAASIGAQATAVMYGLLEEPTWSWTAGPVWLGGGGALTQTAPSAPSAVFLAQIGVATSPTTVFVDRNPSITLI